MKKNLKFWFTLVEVLFVIAVFGIGILAVLHGVNQTVLNKELIKMKIQTSFLWREGIEMLYNLRQSNGYKELSWNCIFTGSAKDNYCQWSFGSWRLLGTGVGLKIAVGSWDEVMYLSTGNITENFEQDFKTFRLFSSSNAQGYFQYCYSGQNGCVEPSQQGIWLTEETPDNASHFARYIVFKSLTESGNKLPEEKVLKVESHILFNNGLLTWEDVIETILGNYEL